MILSGCVGWLYSAFAVSVAFVPSRSLIEFGIGLFDEKKFLLRCSALWRLRFLLGKRVVALPLGYERKSTLKSFLSAFSKERCVLR